jgi:hypothetical protein
MNALLRYALKPDPSCANPMRKDNRAEENVWAREDSDNPCSPPISSLSRSNMLGEPLAGIRLENTQKESESPGVLVNG